MRKINKLIIHCSATPEGRAVSVSDITRWHRERGFRTIGYHYVIYLDGSVHAGRPVSEEGAHCLGQNRNSIGICYIGGLDAKSLLPKDTRTEAQKDAFGILSAISGRNIQAPRFTGIMNLRRRRVPASMSESC